MAKTVFFPPINGIRMTPKDAILPNRYNYWAFDSASLKKSQVRGQMDTHYAQKVQHDQQRQLYFLATPGATVSVKIYNDKGEEMATIANPLSVSYTYKYFDPAGNEENLLIHYRYWYFDSGTYPEGHYFVVTTVTYADETQDIHISEPQWVRAKHKGTVLIKYSNSTDDFDIRFETIRPVFSRRIDSNGFKLEPASDVVVFTDQDTNVKSLYANPYRIWALDLGGKRGVPEYEIDGLNRAFCCDILTVEKDRYVKHEGAKIEQNTFYNYGLQFGTIQLREYYNDAAGYSTNAAPIILFDNGGTYPNTIDGWEMSDLNSGNVIFDVVHEILSSGAFNGYVDYFNDNVVPQHELTGEFQRDGNKFQYVNGEGENFVITRVCTVRTVYLEANLNIVTNIIGNNAKYQHGGKGAHVVIMDSGGVGNETLITEAGHNSFGNPIIVTENLIYASTGNKKLRIYTDDKMTVLQFINNANKVTSIHSSSEVSSKLQRFWAQFQNFNSSINLSFLARAKDELRQLYLDHSNITGITTGWISGLISGSYKPFGLLKYLQFNHNKLNTANVDSTISEIHDDMNHGTFGVLNIQGQSPAAPPSTSTGDIDSLEDTFFWNVNTD